MRWQTLYEGRWIFGVLLVLAAISWKFNPWYSAPWILLILFCINFFRDPDRTAPADPSAILAAADGTIVDVVEMDENEVLHRPQRRVAIFLSVFNVHTNRAPIDGKVIYTKHYPGTYLDARNPEASRKNEALTWAFEGDRATIVVRQITGAIARRIVPWSKLGDSVKKGERFGMIRFGSRTEVFVPLDCEILVHPGDKVFAGKTVIARFPSQAGFPPES